MTRTVAGSVRLERLIKKLSEADKNQRDSRVILDSTDLEWLCKEAIKVLKNDSMVLKLTAPITIIGDVHGQFYDLLRFFKMGGQLPATNYLFLGDYVDRGRNSVETFAYLLALKVKFPNNIWLLRGNHETRDISSLYGFQRECSLYYNNQVYDNFTNVFGYLPLAAVVSDRIFCVHGGLSPRLTDLKQIEEIQRPCAIPEEGLLTDLVWADPRKDHKGYRESDRGTSYTYGPDVVEEFLKKNDFDLICRAHQVVDGGFEFPFGPDQTVLTVFSAPDYCDEMNNKGAMLKVDDGLRCTFHFIDPPKSRVNVMRAATPYLSGRRRVY